MSQHKTLVQYSHSFYLPGNSTTEKNKKSFGISVAITFMMLMPFGVGSNYEHIGFGLIASMVSTVYYPMLLFFRWLGIAFDTASVETDLQTSTHAVYICFYVIRNNGALVHFSSKKVGMSCCQQTRKAAQYLCSTVYIVPAKGRKAGNPSTARIFCNLGHRFFHSLHYSQKQVVRFRCGGKETKFFLQESMHAIRECSSTVQYLSLVAKKRNCFTFFGGCEESTLDPGMQPVVSCVLLLQASRGFVD